MVGKQLVDTIQQHTPFQAILATSLQQAHAILYQLVCDALLLTDDALPEEDLERLYLLPAHIKPALLDLTNSLGVSTDWDETHLKDIIIASIERLQSTPIQSNPHVFGQYLGEK